MADDNVFDRSSCEIAPVVPVPVCRGMIVDPGVPAAPEPIVDCSPEPLTLPPEPPCPTVKVTKAEFDYGGTAAENPPALAFTVTKTNCCEFDFEVELSVPCPTVKPEAASPTTAAPAFTSGASSLEYKFTKTGDCEFELEIDLSVHCPQMGPAEFQYAYGYTVDGVQAYVAWKLTPTGNCDYDLEMELLLPCPKVGPEEEQTEAVSFQPDNSNTGQLRYKFTKTDDCEYELEIHLYSPCPLLGPSEYAYAYLYRADGVEGYVAWRFVVTENCEYNLELDVLVPCPVLKPDEYEYAYLDWDNDQEGSISWRFIKLMVSGLEDCTYELEVVLDIPLPEYTVDATVTIHYLSNCDDAAHGTATATQEAGGVFVWEIDLYLKPTCTVGITRTRTVVTDVTWDEETCEMTKTTELETWEDGVLKSSV